MGLTSIREQKTSLNNLQLRDGSRKDTIAKVVSTHFRQNEQQVHPKEYQVVRGEGKGLDNLLYGAPGVGKTSSAERITAASGRPLFLIICGDRGLTPNEVETMLEDVFRFAQIWSCILMRDECDIFLSRRNEPAIKRNGLIPAFRRTLESYTDVLFSTKNHVGVVGDAIESQPVWTAYYPPLNSSQTKRMREANLRLLNERNGNLDIDEIDIMEFAKDRFRRSSQNDGC